MKYHQHVFEIFFELLIKEELFFSSLISLIFYAIEYHHLSTAYQPLIYKSNNLLFDVRII